MEIDKNLLNEDLTTPNDPNIETKDEGPSIDIMFQQSSTPSLGRQIFSILPIHGPTASLYNIKKKSGVVGNQKFELVKSNIAVYPSESIHTGLTQEVIQDIKSQYGKEAEIVIGKLLRGLANLQENTRTLEFLDANCLAVSDLALTSPKNIQANTFEIIQKVSELVVLANINGIRTYQTFCVLPYKAASYVMGLNGFVSPGGDVVENDLFIGQVGQTKFYVNPNSVSTTAYVGLTDINNASKSSAVFSPYQSTVVQAVNPDSGEETYHIYNRFAITASPLHVLNNEMLFKFNINV